NSAFALGNLLTQGAINAIELNGDEAQKQFWLPRLIDGTWAGTMNLTEPPAGSNLGAIKTMAKPEGDHYRISGQKIFITYGDHELTENIVHLVLARTPDAPAGTRGLSLFVVPKFVPNDDGSLGERNDITCVSLEHKMGIHGSPTAVLNYGDNGGAVGYLVGEEDRGLQYMFTMMNDARFEVGLQGLGIADGAYQHARAYAGDRKQGVPVGHATETTIDHHPDVRRMLMNMQARVVAMRCLGYFAASLRDRAHFSPDEAARTQADEEYNYLIPIVKGWMTETCQQVAYDGLQVHGGWGFIEEMGAAQFVRDARITTLYEGTTGIQAADLAFRKTAHDQGEVAQRLLERLSGIAATADDNGPALSAAVAAAKGYVDWLTQEAKAEPAQLAASSDTYLRAMGTLVGGALLERSAQMAREKRAGSSFADARTALARHFVASLLPEAQVQFETAAAAAGPVAEYDPAWL
ncbi:MAG: acyl-CoA dehydrogenase, partial [Pseudomonadota bacterium]